MTGRLTAAVAMLFTAVPSPSPTSNVPDDLEVTPGLVGFLATFALAAACVLLFLSLTRHLRRAGHNARERGLPVDGTGTEATDRPDGGPADGADGPGETGPRDGRGPSSP